MFYQIWKSPTGVHHNRFKTVLTKKISSDIPKHPEKEDPISFQEMMLINPKEQKLQMELDFLAATLKTIFK